MRWWGSKPQSVTDRTLESTAFLRLHFYLVLPTHNFLYRFLDCSFRFLSPRTYPLSPSIFHLLTTLLSLFAPAYPPSSCLGAERPSNCTAPPHVVLHILSALSSLLGSPRSSLREPVSAFPCLVAPHFPSSTCAIRSLSAPGFSSTGVPSSLCMSPPSARPLPPP